MCKAGLLGVESRDVVYDADVQRGVVS